MQVLHNMHNNARVCIISIIIGIRNYAEIMQKLCRDYAEIMHIITYYYHIMHIINIPFIIGIININIQFMLGDPGWFPEPTQVSTV